jgi:hypothetical protein
VTNLLISFEMNQTRLRSCRKCCSVVVERSKEDKTSGVESRAVVERVVVWKELIRSRDQKSRQASSVGVSIK